MPQVISANTLAQGHVVFFTATGDWVNDLAQAAVYGTKSEADLALVRAKQDENRARIVEAALVDVVEDGAERSALTLRETIRARGPTIDYMKIVAS